MLAEQLARGGVVEARGYGELFCGKPLPRANLRLHGGGCDFGELLVHLSVSLLLSGGQYPPRLGMSLFGGNPWQVRANPAHLGGMSAQAS